MKKVVQSPHLGSTVIGFLDDHVPVGSYVCCRISQTETTLFKAPVLGRLEGLEALIEEHDANELLVAGPAVSPERLREILQVCGARDLTVGVVPYLGDIRSDQLRVEDLSAIPVLRPHQGSTRGLGLALKRLFDQLGALALVGATAPIWVLAAFLIRFDSRGPILFAQERIGRDGRPFRMFKFRTMRQDSEPYATSPAHDIDPRITRIGRYLRMGGLDELPQLINILRGDMSLVGPRPEMPYIVAKYSSLERQRLQVRPGITGLWQLSADRHAQIHENIEYDLYYVNHQSFLLDLLILLETVFFTAGLVLGSLDRRTLVRDVETSQQMPVRSLTDEPCILVALDQRRNGTLPESWAACIAAAYAVSYRWPVRIVVADGNIAALDALLAEPMSRLGTETYRTAYVPYRSRTELRALTLSARLVLTDLAHVIEWAQEAGIDALEVGPGGARWWPQARVPDPIVTELSQVLTVYVAPPTGMTDTRGGHAPPAEQVVRLASTAGS
ncbi:MAG: exopolysaccharide biosynthesis polyprenyl glycosylphosphotransferase, partial [Gemmatimonadota bacterium]